MGKLNLSYKQILEHLEVIDKYLHLPYKEFVLPSSCTTTTDIAKAMMCHVGLDGYEPIIKYEQLGKGEAGHICLNNNSDRKVYISLSNANDVYIDSELATLAHEICHKLLYTHKCYFSLMTDYNEALTDLATIYAGFGKYTLRGCEISTTKVDTRHTSQGLQQQINTTTHYTGYLDYKQYATAYDIVCYINGISENDRYYGIQHKYTSEVSFYECEGKGLYEQFTSCRENLLAKDAKSMNLILQLEHLVNVLKSEIITRQKDYIRILDEVNIEDKRIINPYKAMLIMARTYQLEKLPIDQEKKTTDILDSFQYAIDKTKAKYPEYQDLASITLHVQCPCCGFVKKNALLIHKNIVIRCPKCNQIFYWNASDEKNTYLEEIRRKKDIEQNTKVKPKNNSIINKIRLFFETWRLNLKI